MKAIEFYTTPEGEVTMRPIGEAERQLKETDTDFIQAFLAIGKSSVSCPLKPSDSAPLC